MTHWTLSDALADIVHPGAKFTPKIAKSHGYVALSCAVSPDTSVGQEDALPAKGTVGALAATMYGAEPSSLILMVIEPRSRPAAELPTSVAAAAHGAPWFLSSENKRAPESTAFVN